MSTTCQQCRHFIDGCGMIGDFCRKSAMTADPRRGQVRYSLAKAVRSDEKRCGKAAKWFKEL